MIFPVDVWELEISHKDKGYHYVLLIACRITHWCLHPHWVISSKEFLYNTCFVFLPPSLHPEALYHIITNSKGCIIKHLPLTCPGST